MPAFGSMTFYPYICLENDVGQTDESLWGTSVKRCAPQLFGEDIMGVFFIGGEDKKGICKTERLNMKRVAVWVLAVLALLL